MVRDKANLLAVRFMRHRQPQALCHIPYLLLVVASHRHQGMGQLFLGQVIERVCLVLCGCNRGFQGITPSRQPVYLRIMACGNVISPDGHAPPEQRLPFHMAVAGNTWVGRPSLHVLTHKIIHHVFTELFLKIHDIIRDTQVHGNPSGVIHRA